MTGQVLANRSSEWRHLTLLSKDPPLVHAGDEEDGRLRDAHQQVGDGQVDDEDVGRCAKAAAPAEQKSQPADARDAGAPCLHLTRRAAGKKCTCGVHVESSRQVPAGPTCRTHR